MVADGDPFVIRCQRLIRTKHRTNASGMENRSVKVRVVPNASGRVQFNVRYRREKFLQTPPNFGTSRFMEQLENAAA